MDGLKARLSLRVEEGRGQVTSDEMERANTGSSQAIPVTGSALVSGMRVLLRFARRSVWESLF